MGDLILFLYAAAFLRQYLWVVPDNRLAWALVALASALVFYLHWRTKDVDAERTPAAFWPLVALPLFFFYALRAALPDMSWDVLDYRLINAERALTGWPMRAGDFFPVRFPFNPAPDMVMGLSRRVLGYRLGTLVNFAVLVWTGTVLEKLLRTFVTRPTLRCLCVLLLLLTEHLLFEVNNYMVDLLALPLMLEATRLALSTPADARAERRLFARIGLYLGAGLAFKLTNLAFAVPIVLLCAYRVATSEGKQWRFDMKATLYGLVCLLLPLLPYSLYIYTQTGSPVFPLYNWVFQSDYWPVVDPRTERWGPIVDDPRFKHMRAWEVLLWPLLLPFRVEHTAGDLGPHWGRVSIAFVASIVALAWRGTDARVRSLAFVALAGAVLWSAASGMLRYAMYVELVGGAVAIYLVAVLLQRSRDALRTRTMNRIVAVFIVCVLVAQSLSACVYGYRFEWGGRPTVFQGASSHLREARHFLRDRSYRQFLTQREAALFDANAVWVESGPLTSGVQVMLAPEAPQWCVYMPEFFDSAAGPRAFRPRGRARAGREDLLALPRRRLQVRHRLHQGRGPRRRQSHGPLAPLLLARAEVPHLLPHRSAAARRRERRRREAGHGGGRRAARPRLQSFAPLGAAAAREHARGRDESLARPRREREQPALARARTKRQQLPPLPRQPLARRGGRERHQRRRTRLAPARPHARRRGRTHARRHGPARARRIPTRSRSAARARRVVRPEGVADV